MSATMLGTLARAWKTQAKKRRASGKSSKGCPRALPTSRTPWPTRSSRALPPSAKPLRWSAQALPLSVPQPQACWSTWATAITRLSIRSARRQEPPEKELEQLGQIAQNVYSHNFGDSLEDVADGISVVRQNTQLMGEELQAATEAGFALRDTFGYDLSESARTASALMKNFSIDANTAYNIIATGAQKGADQNGDLLDTLNEYSTQYAALGLSADQFVNGLIAGAEAGVFSIDKVGDARQGV